MKLNDFRVTNFSGGLVTNKSDYEMQRNEFKKTHNLDFDEFGEAKRRLGIQQWGDQKSGIIDASFVFSPTTLGNAVVTYHLVADRANNLTLYQVVTSYLTSALASDDTIMVVQNNSDFSASGSVTINGDQIAYTAKSGTTQLTTVSGQLKSYPAFSAVTQITSFTTTTLDGRDGVYFTTLRDGSGNNVLFVNGRAGSGTWIASGVTNISDADEPAGLFATTYRDRVYVAGSGVADGSGNRNGSPRRVSFSDAGDCTSWDINNFFDVEDRRSEDVTGLIEHNDRLLIFKTSSVFTYNEVQLKQTLANVGAYNHRVIQRVGEDLLTFGSQGVFITNGSSAKYISEPVEKYVRAFKPIYSGPLNRVVLNCFAGVFKHKYYLYLGTIVDPDEAYFANRTTPKTLNDVVLVYDTRLGNWTVHTEYTNMRHFSSFPSYNGSIMTASQARQRIHEWGEALFSGDNNGRYYRLFENDFVDNESTVYARGYDIIPNMMQNSLGTAVDTLLETPFYDLGNPSLWKQFGGVRFLVKDGMFTVSYRLDAGTEVTDWMPLGEIKQTNEFIQIPSNANKGYRIAFRIASSEVNSRTILNGFIIEDIEALAKRK